MLPQFQCMSEKNVEFNDSAHTVYQRKNIAKMQETVEKDLSTYVSTKYLQIQTVLVYLDTVKI